MESSAKQLEIKPVTNNNTVALKPVAKKTGELVPLCKDGVCTLNWKPRRPNSAA